MAVKLWNDQVRRIYPLSLDLHGGSEQYFFQPATREMAWKAEAAADGLQIFI